MGAGRLVRENQRDREAGIRCVSRDRADVLREAIEQVEDTPDDCPSRALLPQLRQMLDDEQGR